MLVDVRIVLPGRHHADLSLETILHAAHELGLVDLLQPFYQAGRERAAEGIRPVAYEAGGVKGAPADVSGLVHETECLAAVRIDTTAFDAIGCFCRPRAHRAVIRGRWRGWGRLGLLRLCGRLRWRLRLGC